MRLFKRGNYLIRIALLKAATYFMERFVGAPRYYWYNAGKKIDISNNDKRFSELSNLVVSERRTYLSYDRLYTLYQCVNQLPCSAVVIEVGVFKGGGSKFIADLLANRGPEGGRLYACDTFQGHANVDPRFDGGHRIHQGFSDVSLDEVRSYLKKYENLTILVGDIAETYTKIEESKIDMIHLDVDVYPATKFVLKEFWPRIAVSGMVVVDDYGFTTCNGAKKAVDEFLSDVTDCFSLHLLTGQIVLLKHSGSHT